MKLYIPRLGNKLQLSENWTFDLYSEYRNNSLLKKLLSKNWIEDYTKFIQTGQNVSPIKVTLPKGTVLNVERIYIRKGASDYDSITFKIEDCDNKELIKSRFWVKLKDANFEFEENTIIKRIPALYWEGWLPNKTKIVGQHTIINNVVPYNKLRLTINNVLRFIIELKEEILDATEENWKLYNFDNIYRTFDDYYKAHQTKFRGSYNKKTYKLIIPQYILTDVLKDEQYIYFTLKQCKEKARKLLKEEFKNKI